MSADPYRHTEYHRVPNPKPVPKCIQKPAKVPEVKGGVKKYSASALTALGIAMEDATQSVSKSGSRSRSQSPQP